VVIVVRIGVLTGGGDLPRTERSIREGLLDEPFTTTIGSRAFTTLGEFACEGSLEPMGLPLNLMHFAPGGHHSGTSARTEHLQVGRDRLAVSWIPTISTSDIFGEHGRGPPGGDHGAPSGDREHVLDRHHEGLLGVADRLGMVGVAGSTAP